MTKSWKENVCEGSAPDSNLQASDISFIQALRGIFGICLYMSLDREAFKHLVVGSQDTNGVRVCQ
jgi:hypothetical protein